MTHQTPSLGFCFFFATMKSTSTSTCNSINQEQVSKIFKSVQSFNLSWFQNQSTPHYSNSSIIEINLHSQNLSESLPGWARAPHWRTRAALVFGSRGWCRAPLRRACKRCREGWPSPSDRWRCNGLTRLGSLRRIGCRWGSWGLGGVRFGYCRDDWGLNLKRRRVGFGEEGRVRSFIWIQLG